MNKQSNIVRYLLDVACEQTYAHVLFRGMVSLCGDASTTMVIGDDDDVIKSTLSALEITWLLDGDEFATPPETIVFSRIAQNEAELSACVASLLARAPVARFAFLRLSEKIDHPTALRVLENSQLTFIRYRSVPGGIAAAWIGSPSRVKRALKESLSIMVLSDLPSSTLTRIRLGVPLQFLADEINLRINFRSFDEFQLSDLKEVSFFIAQRASTHQASLVLNAINLYGGMYVYEIDDLLTSIPHFLSHHYGLIENKGIIVDLLSKAALVSCTQENLRRRMLQFNDITKICGNYGDPYFSPKHQAHQNVAADSIATIMIAASDRVLVNFLMSALIKILKIHNDHIKLVVVGPIGDEFRKNGVSARYVEIIPHLDFTEFASKLQNPIGVIPLDESDFSSCKSAVKFFDYSVAGLATVCSNVSPYKEVVENGVNGLLVENTTDAWFNALNSLIIDGKMRASIADNAARRAREQYGLSLVLNQWLDVIDTMLSLAQTVKKPMAFLVKFKFQLLCFSLTLRALNHRRIQMRRAVKN